MASGPQRKSSAGFASSGTPGLRPVSQPESLGQGSMAAPSQGENPSAIAEEVAEDMTAVMFDKVLSPSVTARTVAESERVNNEDGGGPSLRAQIEQLEAELASARSDLEFAALKEEELENRHHLAQETIGKLRAQNETLAQQLQDANSEVQELCSRMGSQVNRQQEPGSPAAMENSLEDECLDLRKRVSMLESELAEAQHELSKSKELSTQPTLELPGEGGEDAPLLSAAYQQISVLNTQLAHLYTELTMARTEAQNLRAEQAAQVVPGALQQPGDSAADIQKQSQQIADLLSDIKHLQLDLEYHQQKLDQMIEEKQKMMKEVKKTQRELLEARQQVEERDQMLKHREVDLAHLKEELKRPGTSAGGGADDAGALAALRSEAAAKDSALIVSHYELHKEKLMRDRLEQKNLKLMERMQKLMMVVETMRKDNIALERSLASKDKAHEEKAVQLAQMTQKARQLQKLVKAPKAANSRGQRGGLVLELEGGHGLPALQRSIDSARGSRSGMSTPRTPRAPATPYSSR